MQGNENLLAFQLSLVMWAIKKGISFKAFEDENFLLCTKFLGMCEKARHFASMLAYSVWQGKTLLWWYLIARSCPMYTFHSSTILLRAL
jgi:hypothetical protein